MKKTLLISLAVLTASMPLSANAYDLSFNDINPNFNYGTNTAMDNTTPETIATSAMNTISQLNSQIASTDVAVQNSFLSLVDLLSTQKDAQTMKSKLSAIMSNVSTSQSAKSNAMAQLMSAYASSLVTNKTNVASKITKMTPADKAVLVNTLASLAQSQYQYLNIAGEYTKAAGNLTKSSQNIANIANNLMAAKETATTIRNNATAVKNVITQVSNIASACGVNVTM